MKSGLSRFPIPHDSRFIRITIHDSNDLPHDPRFEFQPELNNLPSYGIPAYDGVGFAVMETSSAFTAAVRATAASEVHPEKAPAPILSAPAGMVTEASERQRRKTATPITVQTCGVVLLVLATAYQRTGLGPGYRFEI